MLTYLSQNLGTIVIGALLLGIVAAIVTKIVRDKRKGKNPGCDCGTAACANCPSCKSH